MFAITSIKGIGRRLANVACKKAEVDLAKRAGELSASELESLMVVVSNPRQFRVPDWFLNRCVSARNGAHLLGLGLRRATCAARAAARS
jgi:small subunit ribosomal protein S18e